MDHPSAALCKGYESLPSGEAVTSKVKRYAFDEAGKHMAWQDAFQRSCGVAKHLQLHVRSAAAKFERSVISLDVELRNGVILYDFKAFFRRTITFESKLRH